ncbi:hypothetical protein [Pseudonocardia acaciae]|uniref:hypothetical protein n=1 Tax=Pseudonocardia acaciae TaxID=551276 RepID=UPI00048FCF73|nr:hypothetical protein [Pseudonocardia acaciae]
MRTLVSPDTPDQLARLATDLERRWPGLRAPVVRCWNDHPVVILDRGMPWLYGPAERDPLMSRSGSVVVPRGPRRALRAMAAAGLRFPALVIAHELEPTGVARSLLPLLQEGPRACTDEVARALVGPAPAHPGVSRAVRLLDRAVGGAGSRAGAVLDLMRDPIVFGVVAPGPLVNGAPSLHVPLVAWRW